MMNNELLKHNAIKIYTSILNTCKQRGQTLYADNTQSDKPFAYTFTISPNNKENIEPTRQMKAIVSLQYHFSARLQTSQIKVTNDVIMITLIE